MNERLVSWAEERGYEVGWGPASVLEIVRADVDRRVAAGEISAGFASANFAFSYPPPSPTASVVVVVMPRPAHRVICDTPAGPIATLLPPTYQHYRRTFHDVRDDLAAHALQGYRVDLLEVPLKSLAARLGLVRYGRNNLAYARSTGSYMQLVGLTTDAPLTVAADWAPSAPQLLEQCSRCDACRKFCPGSAITRERVLLSADRCLTAVNEKEGEWPGWVRPSMHHALVGCLVCQQICPANPDLPVADSGVAFSAAETRLMLDTTAEAGDLSGIRKKFEQLGQEQHATVFGRNLRALIDGLGHGSRGIARTRVSAGPGGRVHAGLKQV